MVMEWNNEDLSQNKEVMVFGVGGGELVLNKCRWLLMELSLKL
jgi:hypothetical protein